VLVTIALALESRAVLGPPRTETWQAAGVTHPGNDGPLIREALELLGVRRLVLAIHDVSFPSDADEDVGHGSPYSAAAARLFRFVRELGFTGVQLGPEGRTSAFDPSPYDGTLFSRNPVVVPTRAFAEGGALAGLVDAHTVARVLDVRAGAVRPEAPLLREVGLAAPTDHGRAHAALDSLLDAAFVAVEQGRGASIAARLSTFRVANAAWLDRDALYAALQAEHGGASWRDWPEVALRDLFATRGAAVDDEVRALLDARPRAAARYAFDQMIVHEHHGELRRLTASLGLSLYGDLQIGISDADTWSLRALLLRGYLMGAPPSRTNPDGQPWGYAALDPAQPEAVVAFFRARMEKMFAEFDGVRLDHPHGLVCPWVYRTDDPDPLHAVQTGARLFDSPDLPDHPALAALAIARPDQLRRDLPRYHDGWVSELDDAQVDRYALVFDAIVGAAHALGRRTDDLLCEVLSTQPMPLARVVARHGLGRFRVTQKANLDDPADVYRAENAARPDWVMIGNHDTPPIWRLMEVWGEGRRRAWAAHLARVLHLSHDAAARLADDRGALATAMLAELFACAAENVSVFFADLFGYEDVYNAPGTVSASNWSLRLPAGFEDLYARRRAAHAALDLPAALALALDATAGSVADGSGERRRTLARALRGATSTD
jgi:4-alpha-glucanotransferase